MAEHDMTAVKRLKAWLFPEAGEQRRQLALAAGLIGLGGVLTGPGAAAESIRLKVNTECTDGVAVFKILNVGGSWPRMGTFTIYSIDGQKPVWERRMRLTDGQRASFKIRTRHGDEIFLGLWVKPSWYSRDFRYDAKVICS